MVIRRLVTTIFQTLPTWEVTKNYGQASINQLKCLKYQIKTSEAWYDFKKKYVPDSLRYGADWDELFHMERNQIKPTKKQEFLSQKITNKIWKEQLAQSEQSFARKLLQQTQYEVQNQELKMCSESNESWTSKKEALKKPYKERFAEIPSIDYPYLQQKTRAHPLQRRMRLN